jgi:ABC-type antimicrobial peptide transport system permease subunit
MTVTLIVVLPCIWISLKLSFQQMHNFLKHKMLQFVFKCFITQLLHVSVPLDHHQGAHIRTLLKLQFP